MIKKVACIAFVLVLVTAFVTSRFRLPALESFLFPGDVAGLFVTGGHGGTDGEEKAAVFVRFGVNVVFYTVVGIAICALLVKVREWERLRDEARKKEKKEE